MKENIVSKMFFNEVKTVNDLVSNIVNFVATRKTFYVQNTIGTSKYVVNYHNGVSTHNDGSPFYDMKSFKNKKVLKTFIDNLKNEGYLEI